MWWQNRLTFGKKRKPISNIGDANYFQGRMKSSIGENISFNEQNALRELHPLSIFLCSPPIISHGLFVIATAACVGLYMCPPQNCGVPSDWYIDGTYLPPPGGGIPSWYEGYAGFAVVVPEAALPSTSLPDIVGDGDTAAYAAWGTGHDVVARPPPPRPSPRPPPFEVASSAPPAM